VAPAGTLGAAAARSARRRRGYARSTSQTGFQRAARARMMSFALFRGLHLLCGDLEARL